MKSVCCLALLICHLELEFQKSTAVNLRNPLRSLWLSIGRAQPIGLGVNENAGAASLFIQASLLLLLLLLFGIVTSPHYTVNVSPARRRKLQLQLTFTFDNRLATVRTGWNSRAFCRVWSRNLASHTCKPFQRQEHSTPRRLPDSFGEGPKRPCRGLRHKGQAGLLQGDWRCMVFSLAEVARVFG